LSADSVPSIAEAARLLAEMVGAARLFSVEEQELLQAARDALTDADRPGPIARLLPKPDGEEDHALASLRSISIAVDMLRADPAFAETAGTEVRHRLPAGTLRHYVPAEPGGAWALNLAVLASGTTLTGIPPVPGVVSRRLFRVDADPHALAAALIEGCTTALTVAYDRMEALRAELERGSAALAHLSRNARTRDAWLLLAALRTVTRTQLARGLALSRAGADIQARTLSNAGLAHLEPAGRVAWQQRRPASPEPARLDDGPLGEAAADLDATMAEIDRLLARTAR
jgi:hypothetical protein